MPRGAQARAIKKHIKDSKRTQAESTFPSWEEIQSRYLGPYTVIPALVLVAAAFAGLVYKGTISSRTAVLIVFGLTFIIRFFYS